MPTKNLESLPCNLCGAENARVKFEPTRHDFDPDQVFSASQGVMGTQRIVECRQCGLIYVNPRVRGDQVVAAYQASEDDLYVSQAQARMATFSASLKLVERYSRRGKILDVGAAAGFFLKVARDAGWETQGVEPSRWLAEWGNRNYHVNIQAGTLRNLTFPSAPFDVVTMWDVLEHTPDPMADLHATNRLLKMQGVLIINYPNIGSLLAKLSGRHWWFLLSVHLFYFTPRTIQAYLEKSGFKLVKTSRYFQTLELEHLIKMVGLYSPALSRLGLRVASGLRINHWRIPYYASQTNVVAIKVKDMKA